MRRVPYVRASLVNDDGKTIDTSELPPSMVRHWASGREGDYTLYVWDGTKTAIAKYRNGRKVDKRVAQ